MAEQAIYSHNSNCGADFPLLVLDVQSQHCAPYNEGFQALHWHEEVQLIHVLEGSVRTRVFEAQFTIPAGQGIFINRNAVHLTREVERCRYHSFLIPTALLGGGLGPGLTARYVTAVTERSDLPCLPLDGTTPGVLSALRALEDAYYTEESDPLREYRLSVGVSALWLALLEALPPSAEPRPERERGRKRIQTLLGYLHSHYAEPVTIQALADAAYISKTECQRCFRACLGQSPYQYLQRYRLQMAASLLETTSRTVTETAAGVGFASCSSFIQQFRLAYGVTPGAYRKAKRAPSAH